MTRTRRNLERRPDGAAGEFVGVSTPSRPGIDPPKATKGAEIVSILDKIMGRTKKAAGDLAGDPSLREQGRREERKGEEKEKLAEAQRTVEEKAKDVADLERPT
jgi:uncharacterized protein YjbJ (UPF0337 family)